MASNPQTETNGWSIFDLSEQRLTLLAATCFANAVLAVMGGVLFAPGPQIMSSPGGPVDARFASLRAFSTTTLAQGQLPLWNPTLFAGTAHLGGFESNLYYPPNLIYRILSLPNAINTGIAIHLFLVAMFTFLWLRRHRLHTIAAIYGGVIAMLSGTFFLQASAGNLTILEAYTWCPAALIAMHTLARGQLVPGVIGGTLVITMQILCGYPIAALYTAFAALLYATFLFAGNVNRLTIIRGALLIIAATPFLAAIQLWIGIDTFLQSTRLKGDDAQFIAAKAFQAQNFLTALVPWTDSQTTPTHNANIFIGIITLIAAVHGLLFGLRRFRFAAAAIAGILLTLACLPGLPVIADRIPTTPPLRYLLQPNLLAIPAMLFIIALGSIGIDKLIRQPKTAMPMAGIAIAFTAALCTLAIFINIDAGHNDAPIRGLLMAAGVTLCAATLLSLVPINQMFRYAVLALGIAELFTFAILNRSTMTLQTNSESPTSIQAERVLQLDWRNPTPQSNTHSASGNAALPSQRYIALLAHTQWTTLPKHWNGPFKFIGYHPLHRMLRIQTLTPSPEAAPSQKIDNLLPRFLLIGDYIVVHDREEAFATMEQPTFDPWRTVLLEQQPTPIPHGETHDVEITVRDESVNTLIIELKLEDPAILLMTDAYDRGWRARGLTGSSQWQYDVMPANVALRAIPLGAGAHRIQLEYAPLTFKVGQWVSVTTAAAFMLLALTAVRRRNRDSNPSATAEHPR